MRDQLPLIWLYGVAPGVFNAIFPVWLTGEEVEFDQFVLALTDGQRFVQPNAVGETLSIAPRGGSGRGERRIMGSAAALTRGAFHSVNQ